MTGGRVSALAVIAALVGCPAEAGVFRTRDAKGRIVITNVRSSSGIGSRATLDAAKRKLYQEHVAQAAARYTLPARLIEAVIAVESGFNPRAVSRKGAKGLMQLMPDTAREMEVQNPFDPAQNIHGGARYLRKMLDTFNQNTTLALAAYNAGPSAVTAAGGVPRFSETVDYVRKVKAIFGTHIDPKSSLRIIQGPDGSIRVTNIGVTASSLQVEKSARGAQVVTNR